MKKYVADPLLDAIKKSELSCTKISQKKHKLILFKIFLMCACLRVNLQTHRKQKLDYEALKRQTGQALFFRYVNFSEQNEMNCAPPCQRQHLGTSFSTGWPARRQPI